MTTALDPVDAHVAELERALRGPAKARRCLVREVRDGLDDAADAYRRGGLAPAEAARQAVREFGPVADVAPMYQDELVAGQGRRTALLLAFGLPALTLGWDLLWTNGVDWGTPNGPAEPALRILAKVQDIASASVAVAALALVVLMLRRTRSPRGAATAVVVVAMTAVLVCGGSAIAMNFVNAPRAWVLVASQPADALAYVASAAMLVLMNRSALRTLRTLRPPRESRFRNAV